MYSYDFVNFVSFPSSLKNQHGPGDEYDYDWYHFPRLLPALPGAKLRVEYCYRKVGDIAYGGVDLRVEPSGEQLEAGVGFYVVYADGREEFWNNYKPPWAVRDGEWVHVERRDKRPLPEGARWLRMEIFSRGRRSAASWFDDLRVYLDGRLIYADDFSNWSPYIGAGAGVIPGLIIGMYAGARRGLLGMLVGGAVGAIMGYIAGKKAKRR